MKKCHSHEAHLLCNSCRSWAEKKTVYLYIAHVSNIWLNVSRIVLAPLFYEIIPCRCLFVCLFAFYFVFFSHLPLLPGSGIKEKVIENGDRIMPIDSSDTWKNPKSIECANKRSQKEFEKTRPKAEKGKKKKTDISSNSWSSNYLAIVNN